MKPLKEKIRITIDNNILIKLKEKQNTMTVPFRNI